MTIWQATDDGHADLSKHDSFVNGAPHNTFIRMRAEEPMAWCEFDGGEGFWSVTRHADITAMNRNFKLLSSAQGIRMEDQTYEEYLARRTFQETDPPDHTRSRALMAKAFSKGVMAGYEDLVRSLCDDVLDQALQSEEFDATKMIARELPMRMLGRIIGVPDEDLPWLVEKGDALIANTDPDFTDHVLDKADTDAFRLMPFRSPAGAELYEYSKNLMDRKNREGDTDGVLHLLLRPNSLGEVMSETEFRNFFCLMIAAGNDTTRYSIAAGIHALTQQPELLGQMQAGGDIWATAPDEIIRWACPAVYFRRTAVEDFEMHGKQIKAGQKVLYWWVSGNRDPDAFDSDPMRVDLMRQNNRHLSFGQGGPHVCLGMWLARLEVRVLFQELAKRIKSIEQSAPHEFLRSNFVGGIKKLPVRVELQERLWERTMTERLRLLFCDHLSLARGKYLPASKIGDGASRFSQAVFGVQYDKDLLPAPHSKMLQGCPDLEARYLAADIRDGWEDDTKVVIGDLYESDGTSFPPCGRSALKRAVTDWQALGYTVKVGMELEAYAFEIGEDGSLTPYDTPGAFVYGTGPFTDPTGFTDAIWETAATAGFNIDVITAEYDSPQFEFTLTFDDAVKAVDDIFLFRQLAREVALQHGILLTFLPKPMAELGGNGLHVNFSLWDKNGENVIGAGAEPTDLTKSCIAGLLHHHQAMAGLIAPTVTSYQRLQPASMAGYWANWAIDHRGVTTRISAEGGKYARIEHRMGDATSNPYTLVATVLQAARLGVVHGYDLQDPESQDCFMGQDATIGVAENLAGALVDLVADADLCQAVGQGLVDNHIFIKEDEIAKTKDLTGDALRDFYIHYL